MPADELHERALALAAELARGPLAAQALAKRAVDEGLDGRWRRGAGPRSASCSCEVFRTEDSRIGVQSFLEHGPGKAVFTGR